MLTVLTACTCRISIDPDTIQSRLRELAFLNSNSTISFRANPGPDKPETQWKDFNFKAGLRDYVEWMNEGKEPLHKPFFYSKRGSVLSSYTVCFIWGSP